MEQINEEIIRLKNLQIQNNAQFQVSLGSHGIFCCYKYKMNNSWHRSFSTNISIEIL